MTSSLDTLIMVALALGGPLVFIGFWMGVCSLLGLIGGWRWLASRYRTSQPQPAGAVNMSGRLGLVSYSGVIQIGLAEDGLDLRVMTLFRAGHPALRIPWTAIRVEGETQGLLGSMTRLRLGDGPPLRLPTQVWKRIEAARSP